MIKNEREKGETGIQKTYYLLFWRLWFVCSKIYLVPLLEKQILIQMLTDGTFFPVYVSVEPK